MPDEFRNVMTEPVGEAEDFEVVMPARPESVAVLRSRARDFAARSGAEERVVSDAALAISEAAANAVLHAYSAGDDGVVELRGKQEEDWLEFQIVDHGSGFRPSPSGGLGFGLKVMAEVSDSMTVLQRDEGTTVVLRFTLARE